MLQFITHFACLMQILVKEISVFQLANVRDKVDMLNFIDAFCRCWWLVVLLKRAKGHFGQLLSAFCDLKG